jgi:photosystem II stability/assembly factor-like uncharacterized protein
MPREARSILVAAIAFVLAASVMPSGLAQQPAVANEVLSQLKPRHIGPVGNRVTSAVGIPGDASTYYVGAASGGIWKTTDAGINWQPVFDDHPVQSIGALAIAPSDPNVIWAGTGEDCIRSHISLGDGIYKSTDAGKTWTHTGLEKTGRIGRIAIDPKNPDVVAACALGHAYGPQPERGVFRTSDGGKTWEKTLFVDENHGCSDLVMDPSNPRILFAGMWQLEIKTWGRESGSDKGGLFRSADGGRTWTRLSGRGLPARTIGKVSLAIAPSNPSRVYAVIETGDGVPYKGKDTDRGTLWRSDDGGANWRVVSYDHFVNGRAHYYSHVFAAPDNENEVYFLTSAFASSLNGGETVNVQTGARSPGGDNHDMWIDPTNADRMIVANDGGTSISTNRGRSWRRIQLPIAQMYHVAVDNAIPYNVLGNKQDGPSYRGPSNSRGSEGGGGGFGPGAGIPRSLWHGVGGGESGWATPDPEDSNIVWSSASGSGSVGGIVVRYDVRTRQSRRVEVWPEATGGWPPADLKYRFNWTLPLTISPHDRNTVYVGSQYVHKTTDGGLTWQVISPDLSTNDKSRQQISGGLTPDNIGVEYGFTVMAIAESRLEKGLLWAGTNDGQVQLTRDAGRTWTNVTKNIPGLPPWGTVGNVEPSRYDAGTAYLAVDLHQVNNRDPWVYKTSDYGKSWKAITTGLPKGPLSYARCIREDPVRRGLLYLGTENALHVSFDDGESWQPLQSGLPHAPVYWLAIQEHFNDLAIGTYGRGFWILDDLTPLQQLTPQVQAQASHLFAPRAAYRFRAITLNYASSNDPTEGDNPPYGAIVNYYLKSASGEITLRVLDSAGKLVRSLRPTRNAGVNRVVWDLRHEPSKEIRLRTAAAYSPDIRPGPDGWRPLPEGSRLTLMAPPGSYTVELSVAGRKTTQPLVVRKDPHSAGSEAEIQAQYRMLLDIRQDVERTADMVNLIEIVRSQLAGLAPLLEGDPRGSDVKKAAAALEAKLLEVEDRLIQRRLTGRGQDGTRWPAQLLAKLTYLANGLASHDSAPTNAEKEVHALLKQRLGENQAQLDEILGKDVAGFNELLRERKIQNIIASTPAVTESR